MSTLSEIEEAIKALPADQIAELASWLDDMQEVHLAPDARARECLSAQPGIARQRMEALDAGGSREIPGNEAHLIVLGHLKGDR